MRLVVGSGGGSVVATVVAMVCRGSWLLLMLCVCAWVGVFVWERGMGEIGDVC